MLVTVVSLFLPRITMVVVPVHLPEPWFVVVHEAQSAYPLRGLPEIEVRNQEACWPSVLGRERLAVVLPNNKRLSVEQILYRHVGCVPAIAKRHHERRRWILEPRRREDAVNGDATPVGLELRPARHTVNVHRDLCGTKRSKLVPIPRPDLRTVLRFKCEGPDLQWGVRSGPRRQHRKVPRQVLSRREPFRVRVKPSALKAACDHLVSPFLSTRSRLITSANNDHVDWSM